MNFQEAMKVRVGDELNYLGRIVTVEGIKLESKDPRARTPLFITEIGDITYTLLKRTS